MIKDSKLFDDFAKMAAGATGTLMDAKREIEASVNAKCEAWLAKRALVTREEFEVVKAMAQKAREENEALRAELETLKTPKKKS